MNGILRVVLAPLRGTFARSVAILSSAALIQNALVLATTPILSRLFSPEEFGVAGLVYAFAAIPTAASTGHYFLAILQTRKRVESVNIIVLSYLIVFGMSLLASMVVIIIYYGPDILGGFGGQLGGNIFFIPVLMLLEGGVTVGRIWEVRRADYRSLFRNRMIEQPTQTNTARSSSTLVILTTPRLMYFFAVYARDDGPASPHGRATSGSDRLHGAGLAAYSQPPARHVLTSDSMHTHPLHFAQLSFWDS